jgi:ABC-type iron transport system FetAB permease component
VQELEAALEQCKQQHNGQLHVLEAELRGVHTALQDERAVTNGRTEHAEQLAHIAEQKLHEAALLQERMMEAMSKEQAAKFEAQIASKQVQVLLQILIIHYCLHCIKQTSIQCMLCVLCLRVAISDRVKNVCAACAVRVYIQAYTHSRTTCSFLLCHAVFMTTVTCSNR